MSATSIPKPQPPHPGFQVTPEGLFSCAGPAAALLTTLNERLRESALRGGAEEHHFPTLITERTLDRAEYFQSFPQYASRVETPRRNGSYYLSPAVCYHCYGLLEHAQLEGEMTLTCCGRCFRGDAVDSAHLWEFTMREIVFVGSAGFVRVQRERWMEKVRTWAKQLQLDADLVPAQDPFFAAGNRGKKLLQQLKQLKFELQARDSSGSDMAIASFNLHEKFFTQKFNISLRDSGPAFSGCVAFGLERWAMALLTRHGATEAAARVEDLQ